MSKKKKVTYSVFCFLCSLKAFRKNCLFAFYALYEWKLLVCFLMLSGCIRASEWKSLVCILCAFLCVKSFCKKGLELSLITSFILLLYYHNNFLLSQSFFIIIIIFHYHNLFPLSEYLYDHNSFWLSLSLWK